MRTSILLAVGLSVAQCVAQDMETALPAIQWTFPQTEPVIRPGFNGKADAKRAAACSVVPDGDFYQMYYWGQDKNDKSHICRARARVDEPTIWEPMGVALDGAFPFVLKREKEPWLMYYAQGGIKVALSSDRGVTWKPYAGNPVLTNASSPSIIIDREGQYRMYYTAFGAKYQRPEGVQSAQWGENLPDIGVGYATSPDGLHWTKPFERFLISPRRDKADPYEFILSKPFVLVEPGGYRLWANSQSTIYRVRTLVSRDGLDWHWVAETSRPDCELGVGPKNSVTTSLVPRPGFPSRRDGELGHGPKGAFDDIQRSYICVVKHSDDYRCWFTGNTFGLHGIGYGVGKIAGKE